MHYPLISVIVPVYKTEKYLNKCIESIVNQTYENLEIILVDDGSPDNCPSICDSWAEKDKRIKVIHKENAGVSAARNSALEIFSGKYVSFVDSDDWIDNDCIEYLYNSVVSTGADVVCACIYYEYLNKKGKVLSCDDEVINDTVLKKYLYFESYYQFLPLTM